MKHSKIELKLMALESRIEGLDSWTTTMIPTLCTDVNALNKRIAESDAVWDFYGTLSKIIVGVVVVMLATLGAGALIGGKL